MMRQIRVVRRPVRRARPQPLDLRTPGGRIPRY